MLKRLRPFPLLCLIVFSACGQTALHPKLSAKDSMQISTYQIKSSRYKLTDPDSAIYYADMGLRLSRKLHNERAEASFLSRMATINAQYGNLRLAVRYQQEAQNIFIRLKDQLEITNSTSCLGILKAREGRLSEGNSLINDALKIYEKQKNTAGIIKSYSRLGEVQELKKNLPSALAFYEKAEALQNDRPLSDEYFDLIVSLGKVHTQLGHHDKAAAYYEKGAGKSMNSAFTKAHIQLLNKAGKAYDSLGNKNKALELHREGLEKAKINHLPEEEARSLMGIASVMKNEDADESILHLKNALEIAKSIGHKQLSAEIYHSLSDVYRQQSKYQEALSTLSAHHRLLDSLLQANEGHRIAVLQGSYELAESKLKIEALQLSNERHVHQRNEILILAIAILVVSGLIYRDYHRNRQLVRELTASNQIKDKLFSIIGHDLRNPIGGITQLLAVMEEGGLSEDEAHELITEMRKQGNVTLEILNALLNWGEAQLKGVHVKVSDFMAIESVRKNVLALQQQAADKSIIVNANVDPGLLLHGDQNHFEFIIRNLLSNAIKFSKPGEDVEIATELQPETQLVVFSVRDHGKGISPAQQDLFLRAEMDIAYGTKGEKGTGIGLMLSKEFVKANQGKIWLESELGKGSTFHFSFPVKM